MGATYKTPNTHSFGQSVFIATPAYEGTKPGYSYSLALTTAELVRYGIPFELGIMEGNCHVDDGRNSLVRDFLEGNCTDMLFIDADLMWSASDVIKMLSHKDELVCGAYPKKCMPHTYPIGRIFNTRPDGMMEVSYAPTGFMRIKRNVFENLWNTQSRHGKNRPTAVFFERKFNGPTRDGGDVTFCRKWIAAGGKVVVDPFLILSHIGEYRWTGKFIDYLSDDENRARHLEECKDPLIDTPITYGKRDLSHWINEISKGNSGQETFVSLANAYGNKPYAATAEFLHIMYKMAQSLPENSTILECGCGLSTVILATTNHRIVAIEEHEEHAEKTQNILSENDLDAEIYVSEIHDGGNWYAHGDNLTGLNPDMIVVDGPRRRENIDRMRPFKNRICSSGTRVIIDDVSSVKMSGEWVNCGTERPFVAGKLK